MDNTFDEKELLLRAVYPASKRPNFWRNGRLSSAALKDNRGLSVDRSAGRTPEASLAFIKLNMHGFIVSLPVSLCQRADINAFLRYLPSPKNPYHSEIHGSESEIVLSNTQALLLSREARIEYDPTAPTPP